MSRNNDKSKHTEDLNNNKTKDRSAHAKNNLTLDNSVCGESAIEKLSANNAGKEDLEHVTGGFLGADWTETWDKKYRDVGIIHEKHKLHKDKYFLELGRQQAQQLADNDTEI
ncbi:MAG: hypothetical protein J6K87_02565 [Clostridia bacterium]|nr:hypothetical protein [Clostridia bacterium]